VIKKLIRILSIPATPFIHAETLLSSELRAVQPTILWRPLPGSAVGKIPRSHQAFGREIESLSEFSRGFHPERLPSESGPHGRSSPPEGSAAAEKGYTASMR
jgi:hypothetical protein